MYSDEGPERAAAAPRPLIAVPNVTAHPSTASVPTSYHSMWHYHCLWILNGWTSYYGPSGRCDKPLPPSLRVCDRRTNKRTNEKKNERTDGYRHRVKPPVWAILTKHWPFNRHIKSAEQRTIIERYSDWYSGRWMVSCYIWYSEEGSGRGHSPLRPILAVTKCNSPPINGQCTNFVLFDVARRSLKC